MKTNSTTKVTNGQKNTRKIGNKNTSLGVSQFYIIAYTYIYIIIWIWRSKWGTNEPTNALSSLNHLLEGAVYRPSVPLLVGCIILSPGCPGTHKIHKKKHALKQHSFYLKKQNENPSNWRYITNTTYNILQSGYPQVIPIANWLPSRSRSISTTAERSPIAGWLIDVNSG